MAITFKRDKQGNLVAVDGKGNEIGKVDTMGDNIKKEPEEKETK